VGEADDGRHDGSVFGVARPRVQAGDELAVDFQQVDREPAQIGQRRVARPEVVDGDLDAEFLQRAQRRGRRLGIAHDDALGDLEAEQRGIETSPFEDVGDVVDEHRRVELASGEVDAHEQRLALGAGDGPALRLPARLFDNPRANRDDESGLLGHVDELGGHEQAALGVLPPQQGLDTDDLAVSRLIVGWYTTRSSCRASARRSAVSMSSRSTSVERMRSS